MPVLYNASDVALPSGKPLSTVDRQRMYRLQTRAKLPWYDENRRLEPLTDAEREELDRLELAWSDTRMPRWGPVHLPMAPFGEAGCAWEVDYRLAQVAITIHPKRLRSVRNDEWERLAEEKGFDFRLRRPAYVPTIAEMTPGAVSPGDARDIALDMAPRMVENNGRVAVVERGWAGDDSKQSRHATE